MTFLACGVRLGTTRGDALAQGKPVFTLDIPDNAHLVKLGAVPVQATDPRPLPTEATG